ncbi:MAG: Flp family type IVb pilin [Armatimonadota bacterium]
MTQQIEFSSGHADGGVTMRQKIRKISALVVEYWNEETGLTTIEYALLLGAIVLAVIAAFGSIMSTAGPDGVSAGIEGTP